MSSNNITLSNYQGGRSVYLKGRAYKAVDLTDKKEWTQQELQNLVDTQNYLNKPIFYEHDYEKGEVGEIIEAEIDDEGWLCLGALIYDHSPYHKDVIDQLRNRNLDSFSIGYLTGQDGSNKQFLETSITNDPVVSGAAILVCNSNKAKKANVLEDPEEQKRLLAVFAQSYSVETVSEELSKRTKKEQGSWAQSSAQTTKVSIYLFVMYYQYLFVLIFSFCDENFVFNDFQSIKQNPQTLYYCAIL